MSLEAYLNPESCPAERPRLEDMHASTSTLHSEIDEAIRSSGAPYLHPEGKTLQLDLLGSPNMISWQESKISAMFEEECWSELPQVYARYGTGTTTSLLNEVKKLEGAKAAVLTDCGMQACALLFDVLVEKGSHAIIMRQSYNKTRVYLQKLCERVGAEFTLMDDGDYESLEAAIQDNTCLIFAETYTNPLMRALDPARMGELVREKRSAGCGRLRLIVDNTIATPWGPSKPLLQYDGVDFVVASGTKALGGEDRDLWGYVASNNTEALNQVMDLQAMRGGILDWRRAEALLEKLPGAKAAYERRCAGAARVAKLLAEHPKVSEVFHPSLADHVDNTTIASHYRLPGSLLSFRLEGADEDTTKRFCDVLATCVILRYALSFDGLATKLNHHATVSEYFTPPEELSRLGIDRLVRIGVGLEDADDLIACLNWALWNHEQVKDEELDGWRESRSRDLGIYPEAKDV
jgi:cystathionine beta-lyase/cystathionine gamma-synthase